MNISDWIPQPRFFLAFVVFALGGIAILSLSATTEAPAYERIESEGEIEVRRYPVLQIASTQSPSSDANGSFMKLFRYIDGGNASGQKIEMTSPVLVTKSETESTMRFILPTELKTTGAPAPKSAEVKIEELDSLHVLAMRFPGRTSEAREKKAETRLRQWATEKGREVEGEAIFAFYDPPWTPSFMRRNEVMLRIKGDSKKAGQD